MKRLISFLLLSFPVFALAQKTHTVAAKESFYSIGRMYNVHPKELASYNNIPFDKGLSIGQVIKIPASGNATPMPDVPAPTAVHEVKTVPVKSEPQKAEMKNNTGGQPIYHTVAAKEGLYGITKKYNISIADIKKWNNLQSDALSIGDNLIVGYNGNSTTTQSVTTKQVPETPVVTKKEEPKVVESKAAPQKNEEKTAPAVVTTAKQTEVERGNVNYNGGIFKNLYNQQNQSGKERSETGLAGIFKSTSGWDDGKFYCLHNTAPAGSIVKITNTANGKAVYAKVLDLIPDLKQNNNLVVRLSNAAATELGITENENFNCTLQY